MPVMNGRELSKQLQLIRADLKVLFISGYSADIVSSQGIIDDGIDLLPKPITFATLTSKVRDILDRQGVSCQ
jgi:FixJ family two-component response regulator